METEEWQLQAACRRPNAEYISLFYGPPGERPERREMREDQAKQICAWCAVRSECLNSAITNREVYGVWGGTGELERKELMGIKPRVRS